MNDKKKITLFGLGYVGIHKASLFSKNRFDVTGVDINSEIVNLINSGCFFIVEPGLNDMVNEGLLKATLDSSAAEKI
jgi:UDP-N-acetyl-D-mannosaminuronic acid dehydrogenase